MNAINTDVDKLKKIESDVLSKLSPMLRDRCLEVSLMDASKYPCQERFELTTPIRKNIMTKDSDSYISYMHIYFIRYCGEIYITYIWVEEG